MQTNKKTLSELFYLRFINAFVFHTNRLKIDADYISKQCFFSLKILGAKVGADYASMQLI